MSQERFRILLIEPDPVFSRSIQEMLAVARDLTVDLTSVTELSQGLLELTRAEFEVVICELSVPDGAGLGNLALFRATSPTLAIIVAGNSDHENVAVEAVQAGAQDYLVKSELTVSWLERSIRYAVERQGMDLRLHAAEEKYHSVFDHLMEGIFRTTTEGRYLMANAALARIYGYGSPDELVEGLTDIGRRLYVQEGRREEFIRLMQANDTLTSFESQVYRKDGTIIWISENCRAVRDSRGQIIYYEGTVEDITQRRQAEQDLRNSEALYHSLVETLPQNIFRKDLEGHFTFCNQQFCKALGRNMAEIVGKTDFDFFPRAMAEKYQKDDRKVLKTGQPYATVEEHQPPGGEKMYVQVVKTPLYGADGTSIGLQGIFWDITQQRLADEKIRRINSLLASSRKELRVKNLQMEEDLHMAREIQLTMLPQQYPKFHARDGVQELLQFTHRYLPTGTVGGDFFTISALSDTEAAVFICDVAGHGVQSALVTAMIRALVEELKPSAGDPGQFLTILNRDLFAILKHTGTPLLTTAFYLVADCQSATMRYANAGHPKPLRVKRLEGKAEALSNKSNQSQPALGLFEDVRYQSSEVKMEPQELIMLFTDGLYEVEAPNNSLYSQALLLAGVERRIQLPAPELFDALLAEIRKFAASRGFTDDVCLVGMEFLPKWECERK